MTLRRLLTWVGACLGTLAFGTEPEVVFINARLWPAPDVAIVPDGVILVRDGKIAALGPRDTTAVPTGAQQIDCAGGVVTAGFWNAHVHFTEPKWYPADVLPAERLESALREMLTRFGFTTVIDIGSDTTNTVALRRRIDSGELAGPAILTSGVPLYPHEGVPYYLTESLPPEIVKTLHTPATPAEAAAALERNFAAGADLAKIFLVTGVRIDGQIQTRSMDPAVIAAAVATAHAHGKKVFAHPTNRTGVDLAVRGGVDVLAHSIQDVASWDDAMVRRLHAANITLVPTVTLFIDAGLPHSLLREAKTYADAGGRVVFGTDIGYLSRYDGLLREPELLAEAGMTPAQILASLTTAPAELFGQIETKGRLTVGADADFVVLGSDPQKNAAAFTDVKLTVRAGELIYRRGTAPDAPQPDKPASESIGAAPR